MASCCGTFKARGVRHLGVEPSANVAEVARSQGISTISAFFDRKLADEIAAEHGSADAILAANVMCHIPDLPGVAAGVQRLLKPDGVFIFEDPYLGDMIAKTSYDQIYDEHVFIFSATSVQRAFAPFGLELVDVMPQVTHGGSMRYTLAPKGSRQVSKKVDEQLAKEVALGLDRAETYLQFKANCENSRAALMQTLERLRQPTQARRWLRSDIEEHDGHQLLRNNAGTRGIHFRHHADQAGQAVARRPYSGQAVRRIRQALSGLRAVVRLESCDRDPREGNRLRCRRRTLDRLRARGRNRFVTVR